MLSIAPAVVRQHRALARVFSARSRRTHAAAPIPWPVPKILVEGEKNTLLADRLSQHRGVGRAWRGEPYPNDIVARGLEGGDRRTWEILIGEKAHIRLRSGIPSPSS